MAAKKPGEDVDDLNVFCGVCSAKVRVDVRFCWKCKSDQAQFGPPGWTPKTPTTVDSQENVAAATAGPSRLSFGRPQGYSGGGKVMSLDMFLKSKTSKENCSTKSHSKKAKVDPDEEVAVNIGLKRYKDGDLKTLRGKRLPLRIPKSSTYTMLLEKSIQKMKAFDRSFDATDVYDLLYEDGSSARFMPGSSKEFFMLEKYKFELGRDYKRITFYLCTESDYNLFEGIPIDMDEMDEINKSDDCIKNLRDSVDNSFSPELEPQEEQGILKDEELARKLQDEWNEVPASNSLVLPSAAVDQGASNPTSTISKPVKCCKDVYDILSSKVDENDQFFITIRRKAPLSRILSLWQRQARKTPPTCKLQVHYSGEPGIDSGAITKEFLEDTIQDIAAIMFPDGNPISSTYHVQNSNFRTCGEIAAASIAQGGPPPCFLEKCAYNSMLRETDLVNINENDLTVKEKDMLADIRADCKKYTDFILEHGYTGEVSNLHIEDIVNSLQVSFVSNRSLYMKEFKKGLNAYDLGNIITVNTETCEKLFVRDFKEDLLPDANYLFSLMEPLYSPEGSSKRVIEESIMDIFQDVLISIEDTNITGYSAAIAWNYPEKFEEKNVEEEAEIFENPKISIESVMGWLTGQRHKHAMGRDRPSINVTFDHECLTRNPYHTICFPLWEHVEEI